MKSKIIVVVVLFATQPRRSETVASLLRHCNENFFLVFWDNSSSAIYEKQIKQIFPESSVYLSNGSNTKLSSVYNKIIHDYDGDAYMILDDDSLVPKNYFQAIESFLDHDGDVLVPKIFNKGTMISPGYVKGVRGFNLNGEASVIPRGAYLTAMMSGSTVKRHVFDTVLFDERLSFYGIDTKFFIDVGRQAYKVKVSDHEIEHHSALRSLQSDEQMVRRYRLLFKGKYFVFEHALFMKLRLRFYALLFATKLFIRTRKIKFLKLVFTSMQ